MSYDEQTDGRRTDRLIIENVRRSALHGAAKDASLVKITGCEVVTLQKMHENSKSPSGKLNTRGVAEYSDFGPIERHIS